MHKVRFSDFKYAAAAYSKKVAIISLLVAIPAAVTMFARHNGEIEDHCLQEGYHQGPFGNQPGGVKVSPTPECAEFFRETLLESSNWGVRQESAWALGVLRDVKAIPALNKALQHDAEWQVRNNAAWALGTIKDERAVHMLVGALNDPVSNVAISAAVALGKIGLPAKLALIAVTKDDNMPVHVRDIARQYGLNAIPQ